MKEIIIEPGRSRENYWKDFFRYKELLLFLAWRDILVRYKQTVVGLAWCLIRPILTMVVFTFVFGRLAGFDSKSGVPYPLLVFSALLPWQLVSGGLSDAASSLVVNANLLSKVYFPRLIVPASAVIVTFVDFLLSFVILFFLMIWYGFSPSLHILVLPVFILEAMILSLGSGLWLAAINVKYRDFRYIVPFLLQLILYISPVGFTTEVVPQRWRTFYSLNPVVGIIDGFRWSILGGQASLDLTAFFVSASLSCLFLVFGIHYFRKTERSFADRI